jgi:hypothetical protein
MPMRRDSAFHDLIDGGNRKPIDVIGYPMMSRRENRQSSATDFNILSRLQFGM